MLQSFYPPQRTLMGPGPSDVSPRVLAALSRPVIGHLDPRFIDLMDEIKTLLQYAFQTQNPLTLPISAPGSAGMEAVFVNLLQPGDKVIVCQNGVFGGRMKENVERCGATAVMLQFDWGKPVEPETVEEALHKHPDAKALAFVHAETSTGVCSNVKRLARLAHSHDCLVIVDAVTSLGGSELQVDDWEIDAVYSGTQKCLSCVPGISPVSFSDRAVQQIRTRKTRVQSWFLDMNLIMDYWGSSARRSYHHTAPVNALYALHESLLMLREEGLQVAWQRHRLHHDALVAGIDALGLSMLVAQENRLPQLNTVVVPSQVNESLLRSNLLDNWQLEVGAGLGALAGRVWRVGLMGHTASQTNVLRFLSALEYELAAQQIPVSQGQAVAAARKCYDGLD